LAPSFDAEGDVEIQVAGAYDGGASWRVSELVVRATDVRPRPNPSGVVA